MHYQTVTPFEQWMRDNVYGKLAPSAEIKELLAMAFEGGQKHTHPAQPWQGLTDDEIDTEALKDDHAAYFALGALWANEKLKEKNNG